jgi:hypothetical protein
MVEAIFYVLAHGGGVAGPAPCYGPWNSVYTRWRRWCALGLWQEILRLLSRRAEGRVRFIDGSHVKCHQFATNPAGGQSAQAIGRTKGGLNTKICALVEGRGRLMAAAIAPARPTRSRPPPHCWRRCGAFCWWATRASTATRCADRCWPRVAWLPSRRDRGGVLRPGFIGVFIGSVIRSKTSSSASKSISVSPLVMKNSPSLFSTLSS